MEEKPPSGFASLGSSDLKGLITAPSLSQGAPEAAGYPTTNSDHKTMKHQQVLGSSFRLGSVRTRPSMSVITGARGQLTS